MQAVPAISQAYLPGTGGEVSFESLVERGDMGYGYPWFRVSERNSMSRRIDLSNPREMVARIRERIKLSISELASICGVSRQAVYKWMSDEPPALEPTNRSTLQGLDEAQCILERANIIASPWILDRRIVNGKTFRENLRDGFSAAEWASAVVEVLREEASNRARLDRQLGDRKKSADEISEWGTPWLSESID